MVLHPILETLAENNIYDFPADSIINLELSVDFYKKTGYSPPWICYFAIQDGIIVGNGAFKGAPENGKVEIAYVTNEIFRRRGYGTEICRLLVELSLATNPSIIITAKTLPENNYSTKILLKNNFTFNTVIVDDEDGELWDWKYSGINTYIHFK